MAAIFHETKTAEVVQSFEYNTTNVVYDELFLDFADDDPDWMFDEDDWIP
jgi:hypothetical protein